MLGSRSTSYKVETLYFPQHIHPNNMTTSHSPKILSIKWGRIETDGASGKDLKLFPGGAREWDWGEAGTRHTPGIQIADVQELLDKGATVIVLSLGMEKRLQVDSATLKHLEENGIQVHCAETKEAVGIYNAFVESGTLVGGLIHSTC